MALALTGLGWVAWWKGEDLTQAKSFLEEGLAIMQELTNQTQPSSLNLLCAVANSMGEYETALRYCQQALALARASGSPYDILFALLESGQTALNLGETQTAKRHLQDTLAMARQIDFFPYGMQALVFWAQLLIKEEETATEAKKAQALALLTLVCHHPTSAQYTKDQAVRLQAELVAELPPEIVVATQERG